MKKAGKFFVLLLVLTIIVSNYAGTLVLADTDSDFTIENGVLTKYNGNDEDVTIPDGVRVIGTLAFDDCENITRITIPDGVTLIDDKAFYDCKGLVSISIPDGITSIGSHAFCDCKSLKSITIPASTDDIGYCAFLECDSLAGIYVSSNNTKYSSSDGVLYTKDMSAILRCPTTKMGSFVIPSSVILVGEGAFGLCKNLNDISIPNSVSCIGAEAFGGCEGLTNVTIPSSTTIIGDSAFSNCTRLSKVSIPNGVISIGTWAFSNTNLTSVIIPNGVKSIGQGAFMECSNLAFVTIPSSVISIADYVFDGSENVTINGYKNSVAQTYAEKNGIPFKALDETPANQNSDGSKIIYNGVGYKGSVMFDTQSYNMAPRNIYDVGVKLAGNGSTKTIKVISSQEGVATVKRLPNGNYRITGVSYGTTYVVCNVYDGTAELAHASIKVTVTKGVKQGGVATRNTSYFN